jgi:prefoldin subunit 5
MSLSEEREALIAEADVLKRRLEAINQRIKAIGTEGTD